MSHIILAGMDRQIDLQSNTVNGLRGAVDTINTGMSTASEAERSSMGMLLRMMTEKLSTEERRLSALLEMRRVFLHEQEVAEWEASMS